MMQRLSEWLHKISNGWIALSALIVFLLFTALVLPAQSSKAASRTGADRSPDMSFYYTADELYRMAEAYGEEGRAAYVVARFTFDLAWPLVYAMFLVTGISWVYRKAFAIGSPWQRANVVPLWGALFDYLENIVTSVVMLRYPSPTLLVDSLAGVLTAIKWVLVGGSFLLLLGGLLAGAWRRLRPGGRP